MLFSPAATALLLVKVHPGRGSPVSLFLYSFSQTDFVWPPWTATLPEAPDTARLGACGLGTKPGPWPPRPDRGEVSCGSRPGSDDNTEEEGDDDEEEEHTLHSHRVPGPLMTA